MFQTSHLRFNTEQAELRNLGRREGLRSQVGHRRQEHGHPAGRQVRLFQNTRLSFSPIFSDVFFLQKPMSNLETTKANEALTGAFVLKIGLTKRLPKGMKEL